MTKYSVYMVPHNDKPLYWCSPGETPIPIIEHPFVFHSTSTNEAIADANHMLMLFLQRTASTLDYGEHLFVTCRLWVVEKLVVDGKHISVVSTRLGDIRTNRLGLTVHKL
jgi:hypothetical protein